MAKKRKKTVNVSIRSRNVRFIVDKVLLFGFIRQLHGRFWGLAAITGMNIGLLLCFLIRPDLVQLSTAFSDFGTDVRTAPYFAGAIFFGAYGLWRWRNYLNRTLKRSRPFTGLITITVIGLYLVALMPVGWADWAYRLHILGVVLAGGGMALTVAADQILSTTGRAKNRFAWSMIRLLSFACIIVGGYFTLGSNPHIGWFDLSLPAEYAILTGFGIWVGAKTYQGEGGRSKLSRLIKNFVIVD